MRYEYDYVMRRTVGQMGRWRDGRWTWRGDRSDPLNADQRDRPPARRYGGDFRTLHPGFRRGYPDDYVFRARDRYDAPVRGPRSRPARSLWRRHPTPWNVR